MHNSCDHLNFLTLVTNINVKYRELPPALEIPAIEVLRDENPPSSGHCNPPDMVLMSRRDVTSALSNLTGLHIRKSTLFWDLCTQNVANVLYVDRAEGFLDKVLPCKTRQRILGKYRIMQTMRRDNTKVLEHAGPKCDPKPFGSDLS